MNNMEYIYQHDVLMESDETIPKLIKDVEKILFEYEDELRVNQQSYFFENSDISILNKNAKDGFFEKIGKLILSIMERIKNFLNKVGDVIIPKRRKILEQKKEMEEIMSKYPEYGRKTIDSVINGNINVKDLDAYLKTTEGLIKLMEADKITKEEFELRYSKATIDFDEKVKNINNRLNTVRDTVAIITSIIAIIATIASNSEKLKKMIDDYNNRYKAHTNLDSPSKSTAALKALLNIQVKAEKECGGFTKLLDSISSTLSKSKNQFLLEISKGVANKSTDIKSDFDAKTGDARTKVVYDTIKNTMSVMKDGHVLQADETIMNKYEATKKIERVNLARQQSNEKKFISRR